MATMAKNASMARQLMAISRILQKIQQHFSILKCNFSRQNKLRTELFRLVWPVITIISWEQSQYVFKNVEKVYAMSQFTEKMYSNDFFSCTIKNVLLKEIIYVWLCCWLRLTLGSFSAEFHTGNSVMNHTHPLWTKAPPLWTLHWPIKLPITT